MWNRLDFTIVVFSAIESAAIYVGGSFQKNSEFAVIVTCMKAMRAIRPLRLLKKAVSLRRIAWSLVILVRSLAVPLVFVLFIMYTFAIIGMNAFIGQFRRCSDPFMNQQQCVENGLHWIASEYNFDWVGSGFLTVMSLTSKDSWAQIMYEGLSSVGFDAGPVEHNQDVFSAFYLGVVLCWWILLSNILVAASVRSYSEGVKEFRRGQLFDLQTSLIMKADIGGTKVSQRIKSRMLREGELYAAELLQKVRRKDLPVIQIMPGGIMRRGVMWLSSSGVFEAALQCSTVASTVIYCFQTRVASSLQRRILVNSDAFFLFIFGTEVILCLCRQHPRRFFQSSWNQLNCTMVLIALFDSVSYKLLSTTGFSSLVGWHPQIVRSLQLVRTFQLAGKSLAMGIILKSISHSFGELLSLVAFTAILAISVATMTVQLFAGLCAVGDDDEFLFGARCLMTEPTRLIPSNKNFRFGPSSTDIVHC